MKSVIRFALVAVLCAAVPAFAEDAAGKALLLQKSGGFQHDPVKEIDGKPSLAEVTLRGILTKQHMGLDATKDAGRINAKELASYKLVIFYTQGDLDKEGIDKQPMGPNGMKDLNAWISNGGGFMGFHSAADTSRPASANDPITDYTAMIGGAFAGHGKQFSGAIKVVDAKHPAFGGFKDGYMLLDEWYTFHHLDTKNMHVIALLDPGDERAKQEMYNKPNYPVIWCKAQGKGRIFYSAAGHRPDVWTNPDFQTMVGNAAKWAAGHADLDAKPNYDKVVGH
jgi:type 1 glutamine amidotransferase